MIYLISEETTVYIMGTSIRNKIIGYYQCDNEDEVKEYCKNKTNEIKGTYDEDRMSKRYLFKPIPRLN